VTFLDDYTHFCVVSLLRNKSEVEKYVREFVPQAESRFNMKVSKIRCDNGGEYQSSELIKWYKKRGIEVDYLIHLN
jgi:hypothetical protein